MAQQSTSIRVALMVERGQIVASATENTLTITVCEGMNGWFDVIVSETIRPATAISAAKIERAEFGFLPAGPRNPKNRWSYNTRPPQTIVSAAKPLRLSLIEARAQAAAQTPRRMSQSERDVLDGVRHGGEAVGDLGYWLNGQFIEVE